MDASNRLVSLLLLLAAAFGLAAALAFAAAPDLAQAASARPDTFRTRLEALASMETLNAEVLASRSATRTLEHWCATRGLAAVPTLHAELDRRVDKPADADVRARLGVGLGEPVRFRHVRLACGGHVLSEADNWYVPARLSPQMNAALETSDVPFGKAVAALRPTRETFAVDVLWHPLPDDWALVPPSADHPDAPLDVPAVLFTHRAILFDAQHRPFSEVEEHYTRAILDVGQRP